MRPVRVIPRLWPNSTVVCIGTGPSLTADDVRIACKNNPVIAVNDAYRLVPPEKLDCVLYACDAKWWKWQVRSRKAQIEAFAGIKVGMQPQHQVPDVIRMRNCGEQGLEHDPSGLRTGRSSGYQAINLAVHFGASRIILLGYDYSLAAASQAHFFGSHPDHTQPLFSLCLRNFKTIVQPLRDLGIEVVNASRHTKLHAFPRVSLEAALLEVAA